MDDPKIAPELHHEALAGLQRLNRWSGAEFHMARMLRQVQDDLGGRKLRVIDLATGSGDLPIGLDRRMRKAGRPFEFSGCDISPTAVAESSHRAGDNERGSRFFVRDLLADGVPLGYDVIICSLFLHHLSDEQVVRLLASAKATNPAAIVISDLDRSKMNYRAVQLACKVLTSSPVVKFDGPASVRSAFTPPEISALARRAGLEGARVTRAFPARWLLTWMNR